MKKYFPYFYFIVSSTVIFLLCYPARDGKFVVGFFVAPYAIDNFTSWTDIFKCKFDVSYHIFFHVFLYITYKLLGTHATRWLLLSSILQAGVLASSFVLFRKMLQKANISQAFGIALAGSLLFCFSPYMCEIIIWGATYLYLIAILALVISWLMIIRYIESSASKYLWLSHLAFLIAMYTLEIGIVFPFIIFIYLRFWNKNTQVNTKQTLRILLPQVLIILSFFTMNHIMVGNWIGHYGAAVHLNLAPAYMSSQFSCYLLKYIALLHFFQFPTRDAVYSFVQRPVIGYILLFCLYIIPLVLFITRYKKMSDGWRIGLLIYSFMCFALFPVQNLYFTYLFQSENDRLGYFFSLFFYLLLAFVLIRSFKWFGYIILLAYGIIGFHFLKYELKNWKEAGGIVQTLIREYKWADNPGKVHILMMADNLNGVFVFQNSHDTACFQKYYEVMTKKKCGPLEQYMYMTMWETDNGVSAKVINDSTIKVSLLTGNWLMYNLVGANDYVTDDAKIKVSNNNSSYQITFKNKKPGDVYIYQSGSHWEQVNGF